jgi:preprotein translocase subunit SecF
MKINFLKFNKIYYTITGILVLVSLVSLISFGLKLGIDFTGGSILEVNYSGDRPSSQEIIQGLSDLNLGNITVQMTESNGAIIRMPNIEEDIHQEVLQRLGNVTELSFESIGPSVGKELKQTTITVILVSILAMVIYIAIAFRKVSYPVKSWQYGLATLVILSHDICCQLEPFNSWRVLRGADNDTGCGGFADGCRLRDKQRSRCFR